MAFLIRRDPAGPSERPFLDDREGWLGWLKTVLVVTVGAIVATLAATMPLGCFSLKEPPCAFSCAEPPNLCPANYTCGIDDLCHRAGATAKCPLQSPLDGGPASVDPSDGGARDAE